jgi:methylmalonyl-CoA/ethylmalonyl-CoA epimerase
MKFDHVGVVVRRLDIGRAHLSEVFSIEAWTDEFEDPINGVSVQFGRDPSGLCYEIIAPLGAESPVSAALKTGSRILNHVAYLVPDLNAAADRLGEARCDPTGEPKPAVAYGGRPIQFFISPLKIIIELIEAPNHTHAYVPWRPPAK